MTNRSAWAGWVVFASVMLLVTGAINAIEGLVALSRGDQVVILEDRIIYVDLTAWAWAHLIFGLAMIGIGVGLFRSQTWARITAIIVVGLHAVAQVLWIGAYPIWSLLMIALDTVVLYALTARWQVATTETVGGAGMPDPQVRSTAPGHQAGHQAYLP